MKIQNFCAEDCAKALLYTVVSVDELEMLSKALKSFDAEALPTCYKQKIFGDFHEVKN